MPVYGWGLGKFVTPRKPVLHTQSQQTSPSSFLSFVRSAVSAITDDLSCVTRKELRWCHHVTTMRTAKTREVADMSFGIMTADDLSSNR